MKGVDVHKRAVLHAWSVDMLPSVLCRCTKIHKLSSSPRVLEDRIQRRVMMLGISHEWVSSKNTYNTQKFTFGGVGAAGIKLSFVRGDGLCPLAGDKNIGTPD